MRPGHHLLEPPRKHFLLEAYLILHYLRKIFLELCRVGGGNVRVLRAQGILISRNEKGIRQRSYVIKNYKNLMSILDFWTLREREDETRTFGAGLKELVLDDAL